jgi:hypothetical protein
MSWQYSLLVVQHTADMQYRTETTLAVSQFKEQSGGSTAYVQQTCCLVPGKLKTLCGSTT